MTCATSRPRLVACALLAALCSTAPVSAATPAGWDGYRVVLWMGDTAYRHPDQLPQFFSIARGLGVNSLTIAAGADTRVATTNGMGFYVENVVNRGLCLKFNSSVRDWDAFVTRWAANGRPLSGLVRDYSLDDPKWTAWAAAEVTDTVRRASPASPFAYDLRDELSVTHSANPFDYDFSPVTLAAFRGWLRTQYPSLEALNTGWQTEFPRWDDVTPFTTDQIKNRMAGGALFPPAAPDWHAVQQVRFEPKAATAGLGAWNFAPWADLRTYMDLSLSRTLGALRDAARRADPSALVGIEGTQMPHAFGGYDLWRLSQAVDWMEPYDIGNSREILGSFMPGRPFLTTVFEKDAEHASRRLWHLLLEGDRGCIVWWSEDRIPWTASGFAASPGARAIAPVLMEMRSPLAGLFMKATPEWDPVYLHYSQASIQADWLIESTVDGSTWLRRFSSFESEHNRQARVRDSWLKLFQDLGYSPRFVSSEQLSAGALDTGGARVLVLPESLALSDGEAGAIARFLSPSSPSPHAVFADGTPGFFDEHCRRRGSSPLESRFPASASAEVVRAVSSHPGNGASLAADISHYAAERLKSPTSALRSWLRGVPELPGLDVQVDPDSRTRVRRFRLGALRLVALERNIDYHMSEELRQAGGNERLETPVTVPLSLARASHVFDLRNRTYLGEVDHLSLPVDPWKPTLLALAVTREEGDRLIRSLAP